MALETDKTLTVRLRTINENVKFSAVARENPEVIIDYFPPVGNGNGYTSLELLMISFGSCISTTLLTLLRHRMKKPVEGISAEVNGTVRDEHPKSLQDISLLLKIKASDLTDAEVKEALTAAENGICPVWAMIKGNVTVTTSIEINLA